MENYKELQIILKLMSTSSDTLFNTIEAYFSTTSVALIQARKKRFIETVNYFEDKGDLTADESALLINILEQKRSQGTLLDYERYFNSFLSRQNKKSLDKAFPLVLMPFMVANSIEEVMSIQKDDIKIVKTKKNMLILFFKTNLADYAIHIHTHVRLFERFYKEYLLSMLTKEKKTIYLFVKDDVTYSHQIRTLRSRVEDALESYIDDENTKRLTQSKRTILSLLKEYG